MARRPPDRPGRFEVLGAWLRLWTPRRGAEVPPLRWRTIAAVAVVVLAALGAAAAFVLPRVAEDRRAAREREQRVAARRHAAFLAYVDREQRPRGGRGRPDPGSGSEAARRTPARRALLVSARSRIALDAGRRTGEDIRGVECEPFPRSLEKTVPTADLSRPAAAYACVAVTARFGRRSRPGGRGIIGIPFRLVVDFQRGRFAWCRIIPLGDRDRLTHPLPSACRPRPAG